MNLRHSFHAAVAAFALIASASPALAQQASVTIVSEPGDYIGQGRTYSFTTDINSTASTDNRVLGVSSYTGNEWFYLDFAAPQGQQLVEGVYENAVRYPFQGASQPGLSYSMTGRGCNTLTGRFEVTRAEYGAFGYIINFEADFEQHCEGGTPALFGHVSISNPPPPPALTIDVQLDPKGTVVRQTGVATVAGTVTCSVATTANISGSVSQRAGRFALAQGSFQTNAACKTTPTRFTATVHPNGTPFNQGTAQLDATANAWDPNYSGYATDTASSVVNLTTTKKAIKAAPKK